MITGNVIGGYVRDPKTVILVDEYGNEYTSAPSGEEVELTATTNDIRLGKTAALTSGVKAGKKVIPPYHTTEGYRIIPQGSAFTITSLKELSLYDFTALQVMICDWNTSLSDSTSVVKVAINNNVYEVLSSTAISIIVKNNNDKTVELGIFNDTDSMKVLRYMTYKEIY